MPIWPGTPNLLFFYVLFFSLAFSFILLFSEITKMNNSIEEFQDLNLQDLYMKLQLSDNDFDDWLIAMGLLHGSQLATTAATK